MLKFKKISFTPVRLPSFLMDVDNKKVLVSKKISFGEKN